ncbi:hypothetical protein QJS83_04435 [Bdellovibrio sp. 22V]|uniref:hypothetical protein n=1 Tax=Bdellovibrio TaxID=958 RepID=UPI00254272C0|nr:hypothetical protein [Bdellovibrio sp. 22V]WII73119.1 hypothetical protein QJS83_04435 [Bdellovibrio sp. 22V]
MRLYIFTLFVLFLAACSTSPKNETVEIPPVVPTAAPEEAVSSIDVQAIQRHLGMERASDTLGVSEKAFNTCDVGYGFSRAQNCHREFLTVVHFRLLCRDSVGTISNILTEMDTTPLAGRSVKWNLKKNSGIIATDGLGYGQILVVSPQSLRKERLRLAIGSEFLYMRANEITKVITPQNWCSQY